MVKLDRHGIVQAVQAYIRNDNAKYAILINGAWGSGKTFLYENYLVDAISEIEAGKNKRKTNIYISLYGISSVEALSKQLLTNYLLYSTTKGKKIVKKSMKSIAGILGVVSKAFSFSIGSVSADFSKMIRGISDLTEVKNMVVCFDDLERCTIPINEFFGYVNNLIEHCNCKVLILADESNIGKIFANSNIEQKYQTILTGDRKVIQEKTGNERKEKSNNGSSDSITVSELKELNELLYSENFIYRDIKEKVIGKTFTYCPNTKEVLEALISGTDKHGSYVVEGQYKEFLMDHINAIQSAFDEVKNQNLRIMIIWLDMFKDIFEMTYKNFNTSKYYNNIVEEFLRYSIWAVVADRKNKKLVKDVYYGEEEYVYFEDNKHLYTFHYLFIDKYIRSDFLDENDLIRASRKIETRCEQKQSHHGESIKSTGVAYSELCQWRYMEDNAIRQYVQKLLDELTENKYAYSYYSGIMELLIHFNQLGLYEGNLLKVQEIMLSLVDHDENIQEENPRPKSFSNDEEMQKYKELYKPIAECRKKRNENLNKNKIEAENIYQSADSFLTHCKTREEYYSEHKSFMEYIDEDKLIELINSSSLEDVYRIRDAFNVIYHMGNARDFYINDIEALQCLRDDLHNEEKVNIKGITRKYAIEQLDLAIQDVLVRLGVEEEIN